MSNQNAPDPLGQLTDRMVEALLALLDAPPAYKRRAAGPYLKAVSDWAAELIGRSASQSAGSVVIVYEDMQAQLAAVYTRLDALENPHEREAGDGAL